MPRSEKRGERYEVRERARRWRKATWAQAACAHRLRPARDLTCYHGTRPFCNLGRTVVWRTAPAYSYKRYEFSEQKEYRTNAKLERIAAITTAYLARYCPHVRILDSFRITLPMFEHSCDTHHYLCWRNSTKGFVGADRASAHVLLQLI